MAQLWSRYGVGERGCSGGNYSFCAMANNSQNAAEAKTSQLLRGMDRLEIEDYSGAIPIFSELTADISSSYYGLAMLLTAQSQDLSGDKVAAKATYATLAKRDSTFAGVAQLNGQVSDVPTTSPFYHTLSEYKAWQLLGEGKKAEAAEIFSRLANDENSPKTLAERAVEVLRNISPEKTQEKSTETTTKK
jgi:hypothetical protein